MNKTTLQTLSVEDTSFTHVGAYIIIRAPKYTLLERFMFFLASREKPKDTRVKILSIVDDTTIEVVEVEEVEES